MDGSAGGSGGGGSDDENLIGAGGGGRRDKGLNPYKHVAAAQRKAREDLPRQGGDINPPPLRVFPDGSRLLFDWCRLHPTLLCHIICQITVIGRIIQFMYNKDRGNTNLHKELDIEDFANKVKLGDKGNQPGQKTCSSSMAIGSVKVAMDYAASEGIEKKPDTKRKKPKTFMLRGCFLSSEKANAQTITELLELKGPVGLTLDLTNPLLDLADGIYRVPKPIDGMKRHVVTIVAHGITLAGEVFFEVQNTWGTDWGVNGYGRIIIPGTTDDIFYLDKILEKKKKK